MTHFAFFPQEPWLSYSQKTVSEKVSKIIREVLELLTHEEMWDEVVDKGAFL